MKPVDNEENFRKCSCPICPLYTSCNKGKKERIFCARIPTGCTMNAKKMCQCPKDCPVYLDNKLSGAYFCKIEVHD